MQIPKYLGPAAIALAWLLGSFVLWFMSFDPGYSARGMSYMTGPGFFPRLVLAGIIVAALVVIAGELAQRGARVQISGVGRTLGLMATTAVYAFAIGWLGFLLSSFLFVATAPLILGYRRYAVVLPLAAVYAFAVWFLFENIFQIILPSSSWFSFF